MRELLDTARCAANIAVHTKCQRGQLPILVSHTYFHDIVIEYFTKAAKLQLHDAVPRIPTHRALVTKCDGKGTPLI
jgi:hypothetical protein